MSGYHTSLVNQYFMVRRPMAMGGYALPGGFEMLNLTGPYNDVLNICHSQYVLYEEHRREKEKE